MVYNTMSITLGLITLGSFDVAVLEKQEIRIDEKTYQLNKWHLTEEQVQLVNASGLGALSIIRPGRIDHPLVSANVETWHSETNTFYYNIRIGEMIPTLFDVYEILGLVVDDESVTCHPISDLRQYIEDNFGIVLDGILSVLRHTWWKANFRELPLDASIVEVYRYTRAYLLFLISITIFADVSVSTVPTRYLQFFEDIVGASRYAWGAGALAFRYRSLRKPCTFK
ncbi:hypothetical protein AMTR_s00011p00169480 [Amborella trichopoda]|uniref:Aminotransferase-like plant mobile domain-containing protein n=1 Tax=Amborella trichopoda TaxID=13333 RepID=W1NHG8_AMBTC|nr:hypothetical protein AMTR_s00011p00169480 [Amborella trichopoda]